MKTLHIANTKYDKPGRAIDIDNSSAYSEIIIENCTFENSGGIFIQASPNLKITVKGCTAHNMLKTPKMEYAQFFQVSGCQPDGKLHTIPIQLSVTDNVITNEAGKSSVEDCINLIMVSGSKGHPLVISRNRINGAYPQDLSEKSMAAYSGGGIMLDRGVNFAFVSGNVVADTTNYGIAIAGGCDNVVSDNTVRTKKGVNVGIYSANMYKGDPFARNAVSNNRVSWMTPKGFNNLWIPSA